MKIARKKYREHDQSLQDVYDNIMYNGAGSAAECTGLIPSAPGSDAEYESYRQLQPFDAKASIVSSRMTRW